MVLKSTTGFTQDHIADFIQQVLIEYVPACLNDLIHGLAEGQNEGEHTTDSIEVAPEHLAGEGYAVDDNFVIAFFIDIAGPERGYRGHNRLCGIYQTSNEPLIDDSQPLGGGFGVQRDTSK